MPHRRRQLRRRLPSTAPPGSASEAPARRPARHRRRDRDCRSRPPPAPLTHEQRLSEQLAQAEAALQRGELASPPGRNAVDLFRGALELDPANTLAKAGLVRVADRLLSAAERALTAGNPEDARKMVDVAESLTPATARGAFLMMQIEMERERAALTAKRDSDAQDRLERGATYLRLAERRLRSGALIEPPQDNARFYLEAARQIIPDDPAVAETSRTLQKEMLTRAGAAATAGNAAETERWLANADGAGAPPPGNDRHPPRAAGHLDRRARRQGDDAGASRSTPRWPRAACCSPPTAAPSPILFALIQTDAGNPAVASARQSLGQAPTCASCAAPLARGDIAAAEAWLLEARTDSFVSAEPQRRRKPSCRPQRAKAARALARRGREHAAAHRIRGAKISGVDAQPRHRRLGGTGIHGARRTAPPATSS